MEYYLRVMPFPTKAILRLADRDNRVREVESDGEEEELEQVD